METCEGEEEELVTSPDCEATINNSGLSLPAFSVHLHDYDGPVEKSTIFKPELQTVMCETDNITKSFAVQTERLVSGSKPAKHMSTFIEYELLMPEPGNTTSMKFMTLHIQMTQFACTPARKTLKQFKPCLTKCHHVMKRRLANSGPSTSY